MILALVLGAALGAQAVPPDGPGPRERFVICPGNARCPPRPYGRPGPREAGPNPIGAIIGAVAGGVIGRSRAAERSTQLTFGSNETALSLDARQTLDGIVRRLRMDPQFEAVVEGHADPRGNETENIALAGHRAEAAAAYLMGQGVPADRILTLSWGEGTPDEAGARADDADEQLGARRIVVVTLRRRPPAP